MRVRLKEAMSLNHQLLRIMCPILVGHLLRQRNPRPLSRKISQMYLCAPLPSTALTLELVTNMIVDATFLRNDAHLKELAEKGSLLIDKALRLSKLEEQLIAQYSAAAVTSKAAFESIVPQPYSPSEEELHEVFFLRD
jgi:hypothetical protein